MSTEAHSAQDSIVVDQSADHDELVDAVMQLVEENREFREENRELRQEVADLREQVETNTEDIQEQAKADARDRQRLTEAEERLDDMEKQESTGSNPTPQTEETAQTDPLTPIERLSEGGREDIAQHVTPSVERAVCLFENLPDWGTSTPKGITLRPADKPKDLLEAATGESLAWQQYYRACEALESLSKGAVTFIDHRRHGNTLVFHDNTDVHQRATTTSHGDSRTSLVAD